MYSTRWKWKHRRANTCLITSRHPSHLPLITYTYISVIHRWQYLKFFLEESERLQTSQHGYAWGSGVFSYSSYRRSKTEVGSEDWQVWGEWCGVLPLLLMRATRYHTNLNVYLMWFLQANLPVVLFRLTAYLSVLKPVSDLPNALSTYQRKLLCRVLGNLQDTHSNTSQWCWCSVQVCYKCTARYYTHPDLVKEKQITNINTKLSMYNMLRSTDERLQFGITHETTSHPP